MAIPQFKDTKEFDSYWEGKKFEDLNEEEKLFWLDIGNKNSEFIPSLFTVLAKRESCFMCKWKGRIINPHPGETIHFWGLVNHEWIVHTKTTHGVGILYAISLKMKAEVPEYII